MGNYRETVVRPLMMVLYDNRLCSLQVHFVGSCDGLHLTEYAGTCQSGMGEWDAVFHKINNIPNN